jgi:hypothetical protein
MSSARSTNPVFVSRSALSLPDLPPNLRRLGRELVRHGSSAFAAPLVVAFASELAGGKAALPAWASEPSTRFLVIVDVPQPVLLRVVSSLDLRRPEQRMHATTDAGAVRRLLVASARRDPSVGIVDAYLWAESLTVVTGDFEFRSFPLAKLPLLTALPEQDRASFEIDEDGSYLHWPARDIHLGVSQLLQAVDPMYLVDVAIERNRQDRTGAALRGIREEKRLRQSDVAGLSERQVRRLEEGISRLRVETAKKFAAAFGTDLSALIDEIARRAGDLRHDPADADEGPARSARHRRASTAE